jgi:hypothetical protein
MLYVANASCRLVSDAINVSLREKGLPEGDWTRMLAKIAQQYVGWLRSWYDGQAIQETIYDLLVETYSTVFLKRKILDRPGVQEAVIQRYVWLCFAREFQNVGKKCSRRLHGAPTFETDCSEPFDEIYYTELANLVKESLPFDEIYYTELVNLVKESLSEGDQSILQDVLKGKTGAEIATERGVSEASISRRVVRVKEAARKVAIQNGFGDLLKD